ncbi:MAG: glycosyltransferase family 4 protein [Candidatus Omnitrophica bacterium]|nr:glycosyltransferase family 4 protein [Candidatus Omnitrophota bacterium]
MKVAIDGRKLEKNPAGLGIYTLNIIKYLTNKKVFCYIFSNKKIYLNLTGINKNYIKTKVDAPKRDNIYDNSWFTWEKTVLPYRLKKCDAQIYHQPANFGIPSEKIPQKIVTTIHDLIPKVLPDIEKMNLYDKVIFDYETKEVLLKSNKIITISKNSKRDILKYYGNFCSENKIKVIPNGFLKVPLKNIKTKKFKFKYIFYNGGFGRRKNIINLIKAFKLLNKEHPEIRLVIAGEKTVTYKEISNFIKKLKLQKYIMFTGYISYKDMLSYIKNAEMLVFPSLYEGFGLPILESMSIRCPVVTSNVASMPEIAEDAALLVDPYDYKNIAEKMNLLIKSPELKEKLVSRGDKIVKKYSWDKTGDETLKLFKKILN